MEKCPTPELSVTRVPQPATPSNSLISLPYKIPILRDEEKTEISSHKLLFYKWLAFTYHPTIMLKFGPLELLLIEELMYCCAKMTPPKKWQWSFRMSLK